MSGFKIFIIASVFSFCLFFPAFSNFYTNDDFFHLYISKAGSISQFISFFDPTHGPVGLGVFRPLTTQVFYWITISLFYSNPLPLRIISFIFLNLIGLQIYQLIIKITSNKVSAGIGVFYYLISATHFGHLYYAATFQELGLAFFYLLSSNLFIDRKYILAFLLFIPALISKETAIMLPLTHLAFYLFFRNLKFNRLQIIAIIRLFTPYIFILAVYAFFRIRYYGFASGDSYVWEISPKIFNTAFWYGLWSLNIPEMFLDFIGPGIHINPNLIRYWATPVYQITGLFVLLLLQIILAIKNSFRLLFHRIKYTLLFSVVWFLFTLGPLLFLPWHKFTFYLTLPMFGVCLFLSLIFSASSKKQIVLFLVTSFILSLLTLKLTTQTNWIVSGAAVAARVDAFMHTNAINYLPNSTLAFYDVPTDSTLPWLPSAVLKNTLSDNYYFQTLSPGKFKVIYFTTLPDKIPAGMIPIPARQFLGY